MDKLWFKRKRYGYGWSPATKEGWIVTIIFLLLIFSIAIKYSKANPIKFMSYLILLVTVFMLIAYKKGEKPKWQWGKK